MNTYYRNNKKIHRVVITPGEPAGIGPDITIKALQTIWKYPVELVICADSHLLLNRAKKLNIPLKLKPYNKFATPVPTVPGEASILHISLNNTVIAGKLNTKNNTYVIETLKQASEGCIRKEFSAIVTGPINKAIINQEDMSFIGHTEFFTQISKSKKTVMMLSNNKFKIALVTTHIPIVSVSKLITQQSLSDTIIVLTTGLQKYFNILNPKIYVCGLNPHAGESGYCGQEEIKTIIPALNKLRKKNNLNIIGPLSADTIFQKKYLRDADVFLTMYHDQGLPVLKYTGFERSINITLGLPFIRTSVGHGSALALSGTGNAIPSSMIQAISTSINMIRKSHAK